MGSGARGRLTERVACPRCGSKLLPITHYYQSPDYYAPYEERSWQVVTFECVGCEFSMRQDLFEKKYGETLRV